MTMNRDQTRNGKPTSTIHKLVVAEPERGRPGWRALLLMSMAVIAGITAALLWIYQNPRGPLQMFPDARPQATPGIVASAVVSFTGEPMAPAADMTDAALPAQAERAVAAGAARTNLSAQVAPAQRVVTLAPPTPTATSTSQPLLAHVEAVVGIGGAKWGDEKRGMWVGEAHQAEVSPATATSSDGKWIYGSIVDGSQGWAPIEQMIVSNADRLPSQDVVIIPI